MQLADYPDTDHHAELHKDLLDEIGTVLYYYRNGKRPVENVIEKLFNWFLNHTIYEDSKFGDFQKKQSIN
jgi:hemerythrin